MSNTNWRAEYDEEVTFGKHQGKWFSQVPDSCKQWMLEQIAEDGPSKDNAQFLRCHCGRSGTHWPQAPQ